MIVGNDQYQKPESPTCSAKELAITVVEIESANGRVAERGREIRRQKNTDFTEAVIEEQQQLFPDGKFGTRLRYKFASSLHAGMESSSAWMTKRAE